MRIQDVRAIQKEGRRIGRAGISARVIELVQEFNGKPSYKEAMKLAGRMRILCTAASFDDYWREQVQKGESAEMYDITKAPRVEPVD